MPARKRNDRATIMAIAIMSKGVIIKNDPPDLIPKMENIAVWAITMIVRIIDEEIITIPNIFDFCMGVVYLIILIVFLSSEPSISTVLFFLTF